MKKLYILCLGACSLAACKPNLDPVVPEKGQLNLERYLAVGNSLTAGFSDGSLYRTGQEYSYPAMLAEQFALVGGGDFKQPLLPGNDGYPNPKRILAVRRGLCDAEESITAILYPGAVDSSGSSRTVALDGPFNNTGIPGIRCVDYLTPGYATANPYARRFFFNLLARPVDEVVRINPSFFSLWIGSNDVLGYATDGGDESTTPISSVADFQAAYDTVLSMLTSKGAKGVSMNIPDITSLPYFTTIPVTGLTLTKREADDLNNAYNGTFIRFQEGTNSFVIKDGNTVRMAVAGELMLLTLPLDSVKCAGWGTKKPIPGKYVLTLAEIQKVKTATAQFNSIIGTLNAAKNIPVVDMHAFLKTAQSGIGYNGIRYSTTFISGGLFSLDGIHPSARGYALVANHIISIINSYYGSTISLVDANKYPGIKFP